MKIYVASSWRNEIQPAIVAQLRHQGHDVYDFKNPAPGNHGFGWRQCEPTRPPWTGERLREVLRHQVARDGYACDIGALRACDACVLVLPCGRSAHWELGWAMGAGKRGYVVMLGPDEPELMYSEATIVASFAELVEAFAQHHPDPDINREVQAAIDEASAWNVAHGLPPETTP